VVRLDDNSDLLGIHEIASMAGVTPQAVTNWRKRATDFPAPLTELRSGPVFRRDQVRAWLRKRKGSMATIISTINLKGGVGKTTTTVAAAEFLSAEFGKKVLVIDLDPQTNATTMLIGEEKWEELNEAGHTLAQLFKDSLTSDPSEHAFDLDKTLQRNVSNVSDVRQLDLLPSSLDLIEVQDRLGAMPSGAFYSNVPTAILERTIRRIEDEYDYILVDCPPNLGIITLNGLMISSGFVIPTIPDVLSTYGIPQIVSRVQDFSDNIGRQITPLGVIVSKYRAQSTVHVNTVQRLQSDTRFPPLFNTWISENNQIAASAEYRSISTLRQKYGYSGQFNDYRALTQEIMERAA
jgi:chromosome partitioning protein